MKFQFNISPTNLSFRMSLLFPQTSSPHIRNQMTNFDEFWCDFVIGDVHTISYNFSMCGNLIVHLFLILLKISVHPSLRRLSSVCDFEERVCVWCTNMCLFLVCTEFFWFISMNIRCLICAFHSKLVCDSAAVSVFSISPHIHILPLTPSRTRLTHSMSSEMWEDSNIGVCCWCWIRRGHVAMRCGIHNLNLQTFVLQHICLLAALRLSFCVLCFRLNTITILVRFHSWFIVLSFCRSISCTFLCLFLMLNIIDSRFWCSFDEWLLSAKFAYQKASHPSSLSWLFMSFL